MRIRKNGEFSPLMFLESTLGPHQTVPKTICQLNQSPWDVIPFSKEICSPSLHQFGEGDHRCFSGKESFGKSIGAVQRSPEKKGFNTNEEMKGENELKIKRGVKILHFDKAKGKELLCINECKEAQSTICDHHLNMVKPHKRSSGSGGLGVTDPSIKKPATRALKGQTRATNKGHFPSSNANQFYYYSGFGQLRGRRRERGESDVRETSVPVAVNGVAQNTTAPSPIPIIYIDDGSEEHDSD